MVFFFVAAAFMYVGRKVGWMLSKSILYTSPLIIAGAVSAIWGAGVAISMFGLIKWQEPNIILKIIMGYALGWYVSIPNFGLFAEASIPSDARSRHLMISAAPAVVYIISSIALAFLLQNTRPTLSEDVNNYPKLNTSEIDALSRIFSKAQVAVLSENDLIDIQNVIKEYNHRTGTKMNKADIDYFTKLTEMTNEYYYELGQSLLMSWDCKSRITTSNFDNVLRLAKEDEIRKPEKIKMDLACLDAAARNQNYVQAPDGSKFEFGRAMILQKLKENEIARTNFERIKKTLNEGKFQ